MMEAVGNVNDVKKKPGMEDYCVMMHHTFELLISTNILLHFS